MNLKMSELYSDLDRGDGICLHFDMKTRLCTIYNDRPDKCNIDKTYMDFYKDKMSREQFYELNYVACKKFKEREGERCI